MTDWKPGDVAMVTWRNYDHTDREVIAIRDGGGDWRALVGTIDGVAPVRPLAVIDPESAADVKRLAETLFAHQKRREPGTTLDLAAALREFAAPTPPKPTEPTGLGAVVEDADGKRWVKVDTAMNCDSWTEADAGMAGNDTWRKYVDLNAVRVLSEGVTK